MALDYWAGLNPLGIWSPDHSGIYKIVGVIRRDDGTVVTVRRRVDLYHSRSGRLLRSTVSSAVDGHYAFEGLAYRLYGYRIVVSDDPPDSVDVLKAAVADFVTPEPM